MAGSCEQVVSDFGQGMAFAGHCGFYPHFQQAGHVNITKKVTIIKFHIPNRVNDIVTNDWRVLYVCGNFPSTPSSVFLE